MEQPETGKKRCAPNAAEPRGTLPPERFAGTHELSSESDVAARYHVTVFTVRRWRREGRIGFLKIGKQVLFRPSDITTFEARHEVALVMRSPARHHVRRCATIVESDTKKG